MVVSVKSTINSNNHFSFHRLQYSVRTDRVKLATTRTSGGSGGRATTTTSEGSQIYLI